MLEEEALFLRALNSRVRDSSFPHLQTKEKEKGL